MPVVNKGSGQIFTFQFGLSSSRVNRTARAAYPNLSSIVAFGWNRVYAQSAVEFRPWKSRTVENSGAVLSFDTRDDVVTVRFL
jgi:hypothetical protein